MMGVRLEARRWSTEEVEQRRALAWWVDTVCERFLEIEIDTPVRAGFRAQLEQVDLGAATVNFIDAEHQTVYRTAAKIARSRYPVFMLMQLRVGHVRLKQLGNEAIVRPGECVLIDGSAPYELECPQPTRASVLRLPHEWLKRWLPHPERYPARLFSTGGWNSALCAALASLEVDSCDQLALPRSVVAEQIASLLALAVGPDSQEMGRAPTLFDHLVRTLRARFHETDLSPFAVALEHKVSIRGLHYAFAKAGTTFIEQLMQLRLAQAREVLSDPRLSELPVTEVAARCGFMDPSHFARRFRQRFGQAPLQFRNGLIRAKH